MAAYEPNVWIETTRPGVASWRSRIARTLGTGSRISVTTCSANNAERFAWQLGQKLRVEAALEPAAGEVGLDGCGDDLAQRPLPRLVAFLVLPDVALEVLLEQPVDARGLGEGHASATEGGEVGRERAISR